MIITPHLAWMHLPKAAGTSTDALFAVSGIPLLWRDCQQTPLKHLPWGEHPGVDLPPLQGKRLMVNLRRLPSWLLSNHHHKATFMGLQLDAEPMRRGLFYRQQQQAWLPADWWLKRFGVDESWLLLRSDQLKSDFLRVVSCHEGLGRRARLRLLLVPAANRNSYRRNLASWFSADDLKTLYAANPHWAALEASVYGDLIREW